MKDELSFQLNDALSVLTCLQGGGEISDYPPGPSYEHVTGRVYCMGEDRTLTHSVPLETLDALEWARLVKPERISPPLGPRGLPAEQMERSQEWEIVEFSITAAGTEFLRSRQRVDR